MSYIVSLLLHRDQIRLFTIILNFGISSPNFYIFLSKLASSVCMCNSVDFVFKPLSLKYTFRSKFSDTRPLIVKSSFHVFTVVRDSLSRLDRIYLAMAYVFCTTCKGLSIYISSNDHICYNVSSPWFVKMLMDSDPILVGSSMI